MLFMQQLMPMNCARVLVKGTKHDPIHVKRNPIAVAPRRPIPETAETAREWKEKGGAGGRFTVSPGFMRRLHRAFPTCPSLSALHVVCHVRVQSTRQHARVRTPSPYRVCVCVYVYGCGRGEGPGREGRRAPGTSMTNIVAITTASSTTIEIKIVPGDRTGTASLTNVNTIRSDQIKSDKIRSLTKTSSRARRSAVC